MLGGGCNNIDILDAKFIIDFLILIIGDGSYLANKRLIKGEQMLDRNWHGKLGLLKKPIARLVDALA